MWFSRRYPTAMASFDKDYSSLAKDLLPMLAAPSRRRDRRRVWRATADKVTFLSGDGVDAGAEVFNNYGDKRGGTGGAWKEGKEGRHGRKGRKEGMEGKIAL
eukprot:Skav207195  [mRNA]  locus=scaffold4046:135004:136874:- [translate_table: standard]